jgi:hypothetical protein
MSNDMHLTLNEVLELVHSLDASSIEPDGTTNLFLELRKSSGGDGVRINGNREGLVHFARLILDVAAKDFDGAHQHFDDAGEMDTCEAPLVISLKSAEWDV